MHNLEERSVRRAKPWQLRLRRFFATPRVEFTIGALVLTSVLLTILEFYLEANFATPGATLSTWFGEYAASDFCYWLEVTNDVITGIFIVELTLRYFAAPSKRRYFSEFWLDIVATIPVFRIFRSARALRLLRLVRLFRLMGVLARLSSHYPYIFRRGAVDFIMICGMLALAVVFGTVALMHFENNAPNPGVNPANGIANAGDPAQPAINPKDEFSMENSFWFSIYTLFAGEPIPRPPSTLTGKIVSVFLMFMGLTIFAIFAGTVSAFMIDRIRVEGRIVEWDELHDHIVICGWTPKTEIIIREFLAAKTKTSKATPIVVITELETEKIDPAARELPAVAFINDDFTKPTALERAGIRHAKTCLVLADLTGGRSEQDADARTILAALTVEKINQEVYTCAELMNRSYSSHLELGKVNDFVVSGEYGAYMIAQSALHRGLVGVLGELLSNQRGNEFYRAEIPETWIGEKFNEKLAQIKSSQNAILVGVHTHTGETLINPEEYEFQAEDEILAICRHPIRLD